jgi:hypothetical protein
MNFEKDFLNSLVRYIDSANGTDPDLKANCQHQLETSLHKLVSTFMRDQEEIESVKRILSSLETKNYYGFEVKGGTDCGSDSALWITLVYNTQKIDLQRASNDHDTIRQLLFDSGEKRFVYFNFTTVK